jgi:2-keto-3-deoxy-L-rhamnonate aldolase RhmA
MSEQGLRERFLGRIDRGEVPLGLFISSMDPATTEIAARVGFDFAIFDGEHSTLDPASVLPHVRAAEAAGIERIARIRENARPTIQAFMDVGCEGLIVPHVDSAAEAEHAVSCTRYAPRGQRSMCPGCHAGRWDVAGYPSYAEASEANTMVIPIIESPAGVANIEAILAVDGVDMVMFGPGDLSSELGVELEAPEIGQAWEEVRTAARNASKYVMGTLYQPDADLICYEMDLMMFASAAAERVRSGRALTRERAQRV